MRFALNSMQAALQLAEEYGIPVFPCRADKRPYTAHGLKDASTSIEQVAAFWERWPDALIGVPTGRASKVLVVDVDPQGAEWYAQNAERLSCGRVHRTRRGVHLLYRMPAVDVRNSAGKIAHGVDVRGEGGYIIWWPAQGLEAVGSLEERTDAPDWLLALLSPIEKPAQESRRCTESAIIQGGRNDFLSREAFRMRKKGATVEQVRIFVAALNQARCQPPLDDDEVAKIAAGKASIEPEVAGPVTLEDFYAYMPMHQYIFVPSRELWPASSVNARLSRIGQADEVLKANEWLDQHHAVDQMTWAPGAPLIIKDRLIANGGWIEREGCACFNLYLPPVVALGEPQKATRWLEHLHMVFPDDGGHILKWLAHRVQHPHEKINHALVLGGSQGIGKDTLLEPAKYAVGPWNFAEVSPAHLLGRFNGFVKSVVLRVSEARDLGDVDRYSFYDHMKVYTAAPPDVLRCDEKHIREHAVLNVCGVIITSNHKTDGIYLPSDDRRHYVAWSALTKEDFVPDYWRALYAWYAAGGLGHVAAYLAALDLSDFDPKAPPPKTPAFCDIVDANRAPEDAELADTLEALRNPPAVTLAMLIPRTTDSFREWLQDRRNRRQIPHRLETAGYVPVRNDTAADGLWKLGLRRQAIYCRADLLARDRIAAAAALCREGRQ